MSLIKGLIVEPGKEPYEKEIESDLKSLQEVVGGDIEYVYLSDELHIYCNEEGKLIPGIVPNRHYYDDIIFGTFIILASDDEGNEASLTDKQMESCKKAFKGVVFVPPVHEEEYDEEEE